MRSSDAWEVDIHIAHSLNPARTFYWLSTEKVDKSQAIDEMQCVRSLNGVNEGSLLSTIKC